MLLIANELISKQAQPTTAVMHAANRALSYCAGRPDMATTFHASYDSHRLRGRLLPITLERPLSCRLYLFSGQRTPTDARQRHHIRYLYNYPMRRSIRRRSRVRRTLYRRPTCRWPSYYSSRLRYPQPPTTILCDNITAIGLANDNIKMKRSKAIDMRFHWIRDRVRQN